MQANIFWIDRVRPIRLAVMPRPRGGLWLQGEIESLRVAGVDNLVSLLTGAEVSELALEGEPHWCEMFGVAFHSLPIEDRKTPENQRQADSLIRKLGSLISSGASVAVHCRMGIGRSAMIGASVLALKGFSVEEAFDAIASARGFPVPDTPEQREWAARFAERYADETNP